jgi:hypothetical protein
MHNDNESVTKIKPEMRVNSSTSMKEAQIPSNPLGHVGKVLA